VERRVSRDNGASGPNAATWPEPERTQHEFSLPG